MEQIICEILRNLGLGVNGIINKSVKNGGVRFAEHLNEQTKGKFDIQLSKNEGNVYVFTANNGVALIYTTKDNGTIINLKITE